MYTTQICDTFNEIKRRILIMPCQRRSSRNSRAIRFGYLCLIPLTFHRCERGDTSMKYTGIAYSMRVDARLENLFLFLFKKIVTNSDRILMTYIFLEHYRLQTYLESPGCKNIYINDVYTYINIHIYLSIVSETVLQIRFFYFVFFVLIFNI